VRPTDENQDGSTRPNLLSGGRRRVADDDNILARLERDSVRQALGNRSRAAWHVAAAALVLLLVLFVAWIAYQNTGTLPVAPTPRAPVDMGPASAAVINPASPWALPSAPAPQQVSSPAPRMVPLPAPDSQAMQDHSQSHLPPLVLLEKPSSLAKPSGAPQIARGAPIAPVETGSSAKTTTVPVIKATAPEVTRATPRAGVTMAHSTPRPNATSRPRKLAVDDATTESLVDTDVALLSAIIIHDTAHANEKAQLDAAASCARTMERRCARKASTNP